MSLLLKTVVGIFKIVLCLRDQHVFMWQSLEILGINLNYFNTLNLKQVPSKTKTFFKKLKHHFLVESIKIENKTFPYKTVLPESNVKTTRMGSTKLSYYKERNLGSIYFMFFEHFFSV